jgi:hypothetical protein
MGHPLRPGEVYLLDRAASVQFAHRSILLRLIRVHPGRPGRDTERVNEDGWAWIDGYELDDAGNAAIKRSVYVCLAGLRLGPKQPANQGHFGDRPTRRQTRASNAKWPPLDHTKGDPPSVAQRGPSAARRVLGSDEPRQH